MHPPGVHEHGGENGNEIAKRIGNKPGGHKRPCDYEIIPANKFQQKNKYIYYRYGKRIQNVDAETFLKKYVEKKEK